MYRYTLTLIYGKRFIDSSKLRRHWQSHEGVSDRTHICPYPECGQAFSDENRLRQHMGRGLHLSTSQLNVSTYCGILLVPPVDRWVITRQKLNTQRLTRQKLNTQRLTDQHGLG